MDIVGTRQKNRSGSRRGRQGDVIGIVAVKDRVIPCHRERGAPSSCRRVRPIGVIAPGAAGATDPIANGSGTEYPVRVGVRAYRITRVNMISRRVRILNIYIFNGLVAA
jgi:hypothetical protein